MIFDSVFGFFKGLANAQRVLNLGDEQMAEQVRDALDHAYDTAQKHAPLSLDLARDRYIIFSDLHRGARDAADDFRRCEPAYNAALAYYLQREYTLAVNGDVEELWENSPRPVIKSYPYTLHLEAQFEQQGRYIRLWGNHDKDWRNSREVQKHLQPIYGDKLSEVPESVLVKVYDDGQELGMLFLVHGHQGTLESDRLAWLARPAVRYFWRPIQNITGISLNSPAHDWNLARGLDQWLYGWASDHTKTILIAGHTHHPVFLSQAQVATAQEQVAADSAKTEPHPASEDQNARKPCYFNSGCCCFSDGEISGIEIADKEIRLVRWPDLEGKIEPHVLISAPLSEVFAQC